MPSEPSPASTAEVAGQVARRVLDAPPTLGSTRLVCVDGPAGSGKTTLAAALADVVRDAQVVHCDEMLQGWRGLPGLAASVERLLAPLTGDEAGPVASLGLGRRTAGPSGTPSTAGGLLVLEGVGCWSPGDRAPRGLPGLGRGGLGRSASRAGLARDGEAMRPQWEQWRLDEDALFARLRTRAHADVLVATDDYSSSL